MKHKGPRVEFRIPQLHRRVISFVGPSAYLGCYSAPSYYWCPFDPDAHATIARDGLHRSPGPRSQASTRSNTNVREACMSCKAQTDRCQEFIHLPVFSTGAELAVPILSGTDVGRIAAMLLTTLCSRGNIIVDAALAIATKMSPDTTISVTLVSICMEIAKSDLGHVESRPYLVIPVFKNKRHLSSKFLTSAYTLF